MSKVDVCYVCRDPLPLSISHIPICVSFAFFDDGNFMVVDPTQSEELVADGIMHVAMNKHHEVCMIETTGCVLLELEQVSQSLRLSFCLCLSVSRSVCLSLCLSLCQSLSLPLSVCLSLCLSARLSVSLSVCLCVCLPVCLCVSLEQVSQLVCPSLSVCLSVVLADIPLVTSAKEVV